MIAVRLLLNLTLAVALAVVCPFRCQADAARAVAGEAAVEADGCPCCPGEPAESPEAPCPDDCADCVCEGAVDGPRVAAVELPRVVPADLLAITADGLAGCSAESLDARPDARDGATLRLLLASLLI